KIHRVHVKDDRKGTRHGWYIIHTDGTPAGAFGSWRFGIKKTWRLPRPGVKTDAASRHGIAEAAKEHAQEEARKHERARFQPHRIWTRAKPAQADHTYLAEKRIKPHLLRMSCGRLVVPVCNSDGLQSLQFILRDGTKRFLAGGLVRGCFHVIGNPNG